MTKKQLAWLFVKVFGACSLFNSLRLAFIVFENVMMASNVSNGKALLSQGAGLILGWIIESIVYFIIGIYLLLNGRILFYLFNRESDEEM